MSRFPLLLSVGLTLIVCLPGEFLVGDDNEVQVIQGKGPAYTEPPIDDPSFELMGEFTGAVKSKSKKSSLLGLQIRAIGNDQFDAVAYWGGLPGQARHQPDPIRMIGRKSDGFVVLSGGPWAIFVQPGECRLLDLEGNSVGRLKRVRRTSPTLHAKPPAGATVLFDGTGTEQFSTAQMTDEGWLMEGADVRPMFQDFNLHIEFRLPYMPEADGQKRANSGLYLQSRYESQVLDSFAQTPQIDGCGALYKFKVPDLNMCLPPLVWQSYDVQFTAPRWAADGEKIRDAHITSWINGVKVQNNVALPNKTGAGKPEGPFLSPMRFQNHGDPVRFRNIWVVDRGIAGGEFPVYPTKADVKAANRAEQKRKRKAAKEKELAEQAEKKAEAQNQPSEAAPKKKVAESGEDAQAAKSSAKEPPSKKKSRSKKL